MAIVRATVVEHILESESALPPEPQEEAIVVVTILLEQLGVWSESTELYPCLDEHLCHFVLRPN